MPNWNRVETIPGKDTIRVRINGYANGRPTRKRTFLIPANSVAEAEAIARKRYGPSPQGYHFETKQVARTARQSKD